MQRKWRLAMRKTVGEAGHTNKVDGPPGEQKRLSQGDQGTHGLIGGGFHGRAGERGAF